ncbi:hypothetical protein M9194_16720 [Vibrio sp. S4M6]|uniref:hypothetical protein n=1 Tax=Vibrio sinus TaxID=2946865 RepID=UPI002029F942|nr:hypothetical protein [Vibrio sinus]MCL9783073.1 hypothetical protein [Vibrio sinus]
MDKELLARKLYSERVSELLGEHEMDEELLNEMWQNKASPSEAAKAMSPEGNVFDGPAWVERFINRK